MSFDNSKCPIREGGILVSMPLIGDEDTMLFDAGNQLTFAADDDPQLGQGALRLAVLAARNGDF